MEKLLQHYSVTEIIIFIVLLAIATKEVVTWVEWAVQKIREKVKNSNRHEELKNDMDEIIKSQKDLVNMITEISQELQKTNIAVEQLKASDKDDIKAYITEQRHYFCYRLGYIDDYNLDCIEKRYQHYVDDYHGNSFVADLMKEIRQLPKKSNIDYRDNTINYYSNLDEIVNSKNLSDV